MFAIRREWSYANALRLDFLWQGLELLLYCMYCGVLDAVRDGAGQQAWMIVDDVGEDVQVQRGVDMLDNSSFDLIAVIEVVQLVVVLCSGYSDGRGCAIRVELCRQYRTGDWCVQGNTGVGCGCADKSEESTISSAERKADICNWT